MAKAITTAPGGSSLDTVLIEMLEQENEARGLSKEGVQHVLHAYVARTFTAERVREIMFPHTGRFQKQQVTTFAERVCAPVLNGSLAPWNMENAADVLARAIYDYANGPTAFPIDKLVAAFCFGAEVRVRLPFGEKVAAAGG